MKTFSVTCTIQASPAKVWKLLTDAAGYPSWDTGVVRIEGQIALGQKIKVFTKLDPKRAFPVKVSEWIPEQKMVWSGGIPLGLFQGVRTFILTPQGEGRVEFQCQEVFSGLLSPLFEKAIPDLNPVFQTFGENLKAQAEKQK